ncbi:MAG: heparinase II/III family protein [Magnetospirillum sp.]|nr:heparinase II/III family protein [Magnetospirillum sp.]
MFDALLRKVRQLRADPVLRQWMIRRALWLTPGPAPFVPHCPPYLGAGWRGLETETPTAVFARLPEGRPVGPLILRLAGETATIEPGEEEALMRRAFADLETTLSLHRFAWLPLMDSAADARWVGALWTAWRNAHGRPDGSWAWHPYTAAERALTLAAFFGRHGLPRIEPEATLALLAAHAPVIAGGLEWFGDHHTSNHCANNGRGLYLLGLALGLPKATEAGARILLAEGERLFRPSGVLREGSTHYHLLLTRQWASVWLAARAHHRPEATAFEAVLSRALAVLPHFALPGRLPLVGDISPDCPPEHLFGLLPGGEPLRGWTGILPPDDRAALVALRDGVREADAESLRTDGWLRFSSGPWSGLWHAEPEGFSPMPGHGHQDCGAAEIHHDGEALFVDPGRGSYAEAGEADAYVSSGTHGGLTLDGADPYPQNRPYYAASFRAKVAGTAVLEAAGDGVRLSHGGYRRLGAGLVERRWSFSPRGLNVLDTIDGIGSHVVSRRFVTTMTVALKDGVVLLTAPSGRRFRLTADEGTTMEMAPVTAWRAYGMGEPATAIAISTTAALPWSGRVTVEVS